MAGGQVFTWGNGSRGCLGHGDQEDVLEPKRVEGSLLGAHVVAVAASIDGTAAVTEEGKLFYWGASHDITIPLSCERSSIVVPTLVGGELADKRVVSISVGYMHSAAVTDAGECYTWGDGTFGILGLGSTYSRHEPMLVRGTLRGKRIVEVACGTLHTVAVTLEGELYTWGGGNVEETEALIGSFGNLCKLGHGSFDDERWCYRPRLVPSRWCADRSLLITACDGCGSTTTNVKQCMCLRVYYCNQQCQIGAWPRHKAACKAARAAAKPR
jgi:hypothetical protein